MVSWKSEGHLIDSFVNSIISAALCPNCSDTQRLGTYNSRPGMQTGCRNDGHVRRLFETGRPVKKKTGARRDHRSQIHPRRAPIPSQDPHLIRGSPPAGGAAVRRKVSRLPLHGAGHGPRSIENLGQLGLSKRDTPRLVDGRLISKRDKDQTHEYSPEIVRRQIPR